MLQRVHLENFKALKNLDLDLAKVTVLTGFNSTGKTSVIQSLAFIKQSLQRKEISYNDYLLRLGDYREVVHGHDASLPIRIDATLDDGAGDMTYSLETTPEGVEEAFLRNGQSEWSWNSKKEGVIEASGRLFFPLAAGGYGGGSYTAEDYAGTNAAPKGHDEVVRGRPVPLFEPRLHALQLSASGRQSHHRGHFQPCRRRLRLGESGARRASSCTA